MATVNVFCDHCGLLARDVPADELNALVTRHAVVYGIAHYVTWVTPKMPERTMLHLSVTDDGLVSLWDDADVRARGAIGERFVDLQLTDEQALLLAEGGK